MENINEKLRKFVKNINKLEADKESIRRLVEERKNAEHDDYSTQLQNAKFDIKMLEAQIELGKLYLRMTDNPHFREWSLKQREQLNKVKQELEQVETGKFVTKTPQPAEKPRINKRFAQNVVRAALLDPQKKYRKQVRNS